MNALHLAPLTAGRIGLLLTALATGLSPAAARAQPGAVDGLRAPPARFAVAAAPTVAPPQVRARSDTLPPITVGSLLQKATGGAAGGIVGIVGVGVPLIAAGMASEGTHPPESLVVTLVGTGYLVGTTYGVHYMGRTQGVTASPLATAAGVLVGAALVAASGLPLLSDDDEFRRPNLLLLIPPTALATGGFLLTRRRPARR